MNWKQKLALQAKKTIDARGGTDSLKEDAQELRNIARGKGSASDKLKAAAQAIKTPGGAQSEAASTQPEAAPAQPEAAPTEPKAPPMDPNAPPPEFDS